MSETLAASPATTLTNLLDTLQNQQNSIPEDQRGLAKELADLRERLEKDPSLENDPKYLTQVAWLVQDWSKFSGTNQQPALSPIFQAGLTQMAGQYPGLTNPDLNRMLGNTLELADQQLVSMIRSTAMEVAEIAPERQTAMMIAMATQHLSDRVMDATGQVPAPEVAQPEPVMPATAEVFPAPELDEPELVSEPFAPDQTSQPAHEHEPQPSEEPQPSGGLTEEDDKAIRKNNKENNASREEQEPDIDTPAPDSQQQDASQTGKPDQQTQRNTRTPSQQARPEPKAETVAEPSTVKAVQAAPAVAPAAGSIMSRAASRFASWGATHQAETDTRRINKLIQSVDTDIEQSRKNYQALKNAAAPFFKKLEATASQEGKTIPKILSEMGPGGQHQALGQEFMQERQNNPDVKNSFEKLVGSMTNMRRNVLSMQAEAAERGATDDPAVKMAEQRVGEAGLEMENVPGVEPGKNLVQTIGHIVEKLVEKTRDFLGLNHQQEQGRDSGPSMGA
ncbi:hypothetical protein [Acetobacter sp. LMG 32666]|uniref:hypothetical protein n=1 Tax=Acetobacter sp. LMG 32666 TaxID=2959295 RepID=UPI0030C7BB92